MSASETKKCPRRVAQVLNYAKLDKKVFNHLRLIKLKVESTRSKSRVLPVAELEGGIAEQTLSE